MTKLKPNKLKLSLLTGAATLALAACGGGGKGYGGGGYTPPVMMKLEDQVGGPAFGALFRADPNSDPSEPNANSVPALSLTTDPVAVP